MAVFDINGNEMVPVGGMSQSELQRKFGGKNIIWLGDSIHAYSKPDGVTIPYLFQYHSGAKCWNWAQGGTTMAKTGVVNYDPYSGVGMVDALISRNFSAQEAHQQDRDFVKQVSEMKSFDMTKADAVIIEFGTNDALKEVPLDGSGKNLDVNTTGGALRYMIGSLQRKYPKLKIAVCNVQPDQGFLDAEHQKPYDTKAQTEKINQVCQELGIPLIDIYNLLGLNTNTKGFLLDDGLHRNHEGKLKQVQVIENRMCLYF